MRKRTYGKNILKKASKIKLVAMDVDGVLTDGSIVVRESGEEVKAWSVRDRIGFYFARMSGSALKFVWITGRGSKVVAQQSDDLKIDAVFQNCMSKLEAIKQCMERFSVSLSEIAFIGDDLIDLPVLRRAGLSVCPLDAVPEVRRHVDVVSAYPGGKGVFRETLEIILTAKGLWKKVVDEYTVLGTQHQ